MRSKEFYLKELKKHGVIAGNTRMSTLERLYKENVIPKKTRQAIVKRVEELGYKMGCWDNKLYLLNPTNLKKVLDNLDQEHTDVKICINRKHHVVEITTVDGEKDFSVLTKAEYIDRYGSEKYED